MSVPAVRPRSTRAFTLIEVLVSLAIVAAAGLVLAMAFTNVLRDYNAIVHRSDHADDLLLVHAAIDSTADPAVAQTWNDVPLPDGKKARWRATITPGQIADLFAVDCDIEVTAPEGADSYKLTEHFMLLRPTWSQPADRETLRAASRDKLADRKWN